MKKSLETQEQELEQKRREFMAEKAQWEQTNRPEEWVIISYVWQYMYHVLAITNSFIVYNLELI